MRTRLVTGFIAAATFWLASPAWAVVGVGLNGDGTLLRFPGQVAECGSGDGAYQRAYPNGQKMVKGKCKGGLYVGTWKAYHPNGEKMWEVSFEAGRPEGTYHSWWENGQERVKGS